MKWILIFSFYVHIFINSFSHTNTHMAAYDGQLRSLGLFTVSAYMQWHLLSTFQSIIDSNYRTVKYLYRTSQWENYIFVHCSVRLQFDAWLIVLTPIQLGRFIYDYFRFYYGIEKTMSLFWRRVTKWFSVHYNDKNLITILTCSVRLVGELFLLVMMDDHQILTITSKLKNTNRLLEHHCGLVSF